MPDRLHLSYWLRGYTEHNMSRHFERMLRKFPFSRLAQQNSVLRVRAISDREPELLEREFKTPFDVDEVLDAAREFQQADCAVQLESWWDLWQYTGEWRLTPSSVLLECLGPKYETGAGEHLRVDFGMDTLFLPQIQYENYAFMAKSNVRSLLHLVRELDDVLSVAQRTLLTESGENFASTYQNSVFGDTISPRLV